MRQVKQIEIDKIADDKYKRVSAKNAEGKFISDNIKTVYVKKGQSNIVNINQKT